MVKTTAGANVCPTPAMMRRSSLSQQRLTACQTDLTALSSMNYCPQGQRAMRSIVRCGIWKPRLPENAHGSLRGCLRPSPRLRPIPSRLIRLQRCKSRRQSTRFARFLRSNSARLMICPALKLSALGRRNRGSLLTPMKAGLGLFTLILCHIFSALAFHLSSSLCLQAMMKG